MNPQETRTALIAGGTGDIGQAISSKLGEMGYRLALAARTEGPLRTVGEHLTTLGLHVRGFACDITKEAEVQELIRSVTSAFDRIDVLVNAAGMGRTEFILRSRIETWNDVLTTNLLGAVFLCKAVLRTMRRQQSGYIINIGSTTGRQGVAGLAAYSASKAGLRAMTDSLRQEVRHSGVKVSTISPAQVDTRMHGTEVPGADRMLRPDDVAEAVAFLLRLSPTAVVPELLLHADE